MFSVRRKSNLQEILSEQEYNICINQRGCRKIIKLDD